MSATENPIAWAKNINGQLVIEDCPLCGKRHFHGLGDGHRVAHCGRGGYIVKERKEPANCPAKGIC